MKEVDVVSRELKRLRGISRDMQPDKLQGYLEWAAMWGLKGQSVVNSCLDLAKTTNQDLWFLQRRKMEEWNRKRAEFLERLRPPRTIRMQLYPAYFAAISTGVKRYEGRAYNPKSGKNYADLREGDKIVFNICREVEGWREENEQLGIDSDSLMEVKVRVVHYSPTVHGIYQYATRGDSLGGEFQPMIKGNSELLELQRAAVYYTFPAYKQRIIEHGFLGIELREPRLFRA